MTSFKIFARAAGVLAGLTAFGVANAATTAETLGGTVRVNQGGGFTVLQGSGTVKPGDTIMADLKGKGRIVYGDGCTVNVKPGSIVTVAEVSPCSLTAQAPGDRDRRDAGYVPLPDASTGLAVAAGAAALGGGAAALALSGSGHNTGYLLVPPRPASP